MSDPKQLAPVIGFVTDRTQTLCALPAVQAALSDIKRDEKVTLADQIAITEVEAPPFHEKNRGLNMIERFKALGLEDVGPRGQRRCRAPRRGQWPRARAGSPSGHGFPGGHRRQGA